MKALVLKAPSTFAYEEVPTPDLRDDEVLVRVQACGICGSDVHGMDGSSGRRIPPIIMGHEAAGVIETTGAATSGFAPGDRVTFDSTVYCGACHYCRKGLINLCEDRRVLGVSCEEYRRHGAFAEYVAVPARILYPLPDAVTFERAAMVEPLSVALHAVELLPARLGDTAVVVGAGMIGLLAIQVLRAAGCSQIVAVDIEEAKLELATKLGATLTLNSTESDVTQEVRSVTDGRGAPLAVEAVGIAESLRTAVECVEKGGSVAVIGNLTPAVELPLQLAVTRQITLYGSCASCGEYPACLNLIAQGQIDVDALISAAAPLSEGAIWFERLYAGEKGLMKVILRPT